MPDTTRPCGGCQPPSSARRRHKRYAPHKPSQANSPRGLSQANQGHGPPSSFGSRDVGRSIQEFERCHLSASEQICCCIFVRMPIGGNVQTPVVNQLRHAGRQAGFHQVLDLLWHTATCSRKNLGKINTEHHSSHATGAVISDVYALNWQAWSFRVIEWG